MAVRSVCRKAACFSCFLVVVGAVEFLLVLQLHSTLHYRNEEEILLAERALSTYQETERRGAGLQLQMYGWRQTGTQLGDGERGGANDDQDSREVRLARELHDLRMDGLKNFRHKTGSLLADQQKRNSDLRNRELQLANRTQQPQGANNHDKLLLKLKKFLQERSANATHLAADTLSLDEALKQSFNEKERLGQALDELYDVLYTEGGGRRLVKYTLDEDYLEDGEEFLEEEEEEDYRRVFDPDDFIISIDADGKVNITHKQLEPEVLLENLTLPVRNMTPYEKDGSNIMLTIRTTVSYHRKRLPLLFETWLTKVDSSQVFLVTDGDDPFTRLWTSVKGIHYVDAKCGNSYTREQLCCKAGVELELILQEQNKAFDWICHVDDDMYVNMKNLIGLLSVLDPRKDPIYLGRSGSPWHKPRRVRKEAKLSQPGKKYHFAVGGMYCLSRAMLEKTEKWLVGGRAFSEACSLTREPEDVTVGFIVALQNYSLTRTERIYTHGLHLASTVDPYTLAEQVAFSYGYGSVQWGEDQYNAIYVPDALFGLEEDESQFRSLHCLLYPGTSWCLHQKEMLQLQGNQNGQDRQEDSDYSDL